MKKYPKVPRYDHPVIDDEFWGQDDIVVLEKMDGQNYKFFLYDPSLEYYVENVDENEDFRSDISKDQIKEGDVVFGTKKVVRGSTGMDRSEIDPKYHRAYDELVGINVDRIKELQDEHGALVFFAEHMVPHSIKGYYKGDNVVPGLLGFDVYCPSLDDRDEYNSHPYEERFIGFFDFQKARDVFESIGLDFVPVIETGVNSNNISEWEDYDIPSSNFSSEAEGIVIRSDEFGRRVKKTSEYFDEILKKNWGMNPDDAETGEEYIVANTVTTPRVRKMFNKTINKNLDYKNIPKMVVEDIWEEEIEEIKSLRNMKINPYRMNDLVLERVEAELETVLETSNLIDEYNEYGNLDDIDPENIEVSVDRSTVPSEYEDKVEEYFVDKYITEEYIFTIASKHYDREVERNDINELHKMITNSFWYDYYDEVIKYDERLKPSKVKSLVASKCARLIPL